MQSASHGIDSRVLPRPSNFHNSISRANRFAANPILIAVSILSPVNTHILIDADLNAAIHSGTCSCSLSSIAVAPINSKLCSIIACASSICCSRSSPILAFAASYFFIHFSNSCSSTFLYANTNVLSPAFANASICLLV
ncbi:hypothetical protein AX774_g4572 [Zancudomyces culisetae]|uniref:Uncharacterized protein n=1 Tax=Zancudomyces culisetae TaxID=1213189 RepID=A0A1R1PLW5_ZANCU|nr:hypothetical protein AX774_g4572 [Zancudomyces culisetae]|eukprot:OMH81960.1 hypothetical protein AX774_g4572 [Zancudomyces culisetae]